MPLRFVIGSDFAQSREAQKRILERVARAGYDNHNIFAIKLALEEALVNAIKHGNKMDAAKRIIIEARIDPRRAQIVVEDQGTGFNRKTVPDPTCDENLHKCSGRGILLMEAYMDSVRWTKRGRRVKMIKLNTPDVLPRT